MKKLVTATLLVALAGASRADGGAAPAPAAGADKTAKREDGQRGAARAKQKPRKPAAEKPPATSPGGAQDAKGEKPCEPVKPCPID